MQVISTEQTHTYESVNCDGDTWIKEQCGLQRLRNQGVTHFKESLSNKVGITTIRVHVHLIV